MIEPQATSRLIGKPLPLTADDLDLAAEVTQVDVIMARGWWWRHAPPRFLDLLEAMRHQ